MSAQIQSPSELPPTQNLAPIKPLLELKRGAKHPSTYLQKAIQKKFEHYHRRDRDVFKGIFNVGQLISHFINGEQFPVRNPVNGSWGVLPNMGNSNSSQRALNIMNNLKQNLLGKWENSSPDIIIRPGRNLDTCVSAAKAADTINDYYERQFYNHWFTQQEGLMGMIFGTYIDRYRFDDAKVSMSIISDIFEQKDATFGDGYGFCGDCQYGGTANEFQQNQLGDHKFMESMGAETPLPASCPNCGSSAVTVESPATDSIYSMSGRQEKQHGDLTCELLPLPACRWDLAKRPEDSNYFIYRQRIPKGSVTRVLGNVLLPQDHTDHDYGLEVLQTLNKQGNALGGRSIGRDYDEQRTDEATFDEMWLSPDCYADVNLMGDEETVDGPTIPKGKLIDVFPDGLCAVGLNGMAVVLALYPEQHRNHLVSGTWFMQSQTGAGRGLADSVEVQKQFNTMNNQAREYMSATYTPAIMYDNQILTGNKMRYIGTSKTNIPVDLTKLPEGRKLADAIHQMQPTAMPAQFFNYSQNFMSVMAQKTSMVSDFANGEPGITATNTTATAAEIDQGNADAINEPIFLIKGDARVRGAEITINLFRQHFPMKRYFDLGGRYGEQQGIELSAADLKADLSFELDKGSVMPKGPFTRRKNLMAFYGVLGGAEGVSIMEQTNPRLLNNTAQEFDIDLEINDFDAVAELCRRRLDQMKQAVKVGVTDPNVLITEAIKPPISAKELDLGQKGKWFASWLSTDEGLNAPMPLRAAAELLADGLIAGQTAQDVEDATRQGTIAAAAQAPAAIGGAALEQQTAQPENTEPDGTAILQANQEAAAHEHEAKESELDRQHEKDMLGKELDKDKETAKVEADHKIRIEKARPKPKPAAKKAAKK